MLKLAGVGLDFADTSLPMSWLASQRRKLKQRGLRYSPPLDDLDAACQLVAILWRGASLSLPTHVPVWHYELGMSVWNAS